MCMDARLQWNFNISLDLGPRSKQSSDFGKSASHYWYDEKIVSVVVLLIWTILYFLYDKYCNCYLRTQGHAKLRRKHISNIIWSSGVLSIITVYTVFLWNSVSYPALNAVIVRGFLVHYTGILFFGSRAWLPSLGHLLHIIFVFGFPRSSIPSPIASTFVLKNVDIVLLDLCKILHLKRSRNQRFAHAEYLYVVYCIFWTYLYLVHVPSIIISCKQQSMYEALSLYTWTVAQYLNFVWIDFIKYYKSKKYPELCLFPNPPIESVHLKRIWNKRRYSNNRTVNESILAKKKLSETLFCAIAIKKKLYRLRKSKQEKLAKIEPQEVTANEEEQSNRSDE